MSYIAKLWRGEECLVVTYWVFGTVILWSLTAIAGHLMTALTSARQISEGGLFVVLGYHLATIAYMIFAWVAVWRSASRYSGWRVWPILAKMVVVAGVLGVAAGAVIGTSSHEVLPVVDAT